MEEKIKLEISGLSYSQTQTGAYALVLSETKGKRSLPIIIGSFEAQAIAIELEDMKPSRPLTHDVFKNFAAAFGIMLEEVVIYNLLEGVFYAKLICIGPNGEKTEIDARTSDAIALAVRFKCPVHTFEFILKNAGVIIDEDAEIRTQEDDGAFELAEVNKNPLVSKTVDQLEEMLRDALESEDYELATRLRDELTARK
ncbi:MAG: bifunctional nuclease domain-containing protein [Flavobacteriales bacterium]|mgnify:FL=1|jgi:bifunctional DNase/RNase|tara:strand:+ start:86 stop:679 length:594 start_codon:yes stop_codon:yes gene_type:complete